MIAKPVVNSDDLCICGHIKSKHKEVHRLLGGHVCQAFDAQDEKLTAFSCKCLRYRKAIAQLNGSENES